MARNRQRRNRGRRGGQIAAQPRRQRRNNNQNNQQPRRNRRRNNNQQNRTGPMEQLGSMVGSALGYPRVGRLLGSAIGKVTGSGDYTLSMPVSSNTLAGSTPPAFGELSGATRIRHREYLRDIMGSTAFQNQSWALNPGNSTLFPWLSYMAGNFEQYHIHGLVFEFKSTSASALNSTNTALGVVGMVTEYDVSNPDLQSKQEFENYSGAQSANPSQSMLHFVECAPRQNVLDRMYVRTGPVPSGQDPKFYDMGKFEVFTQGMQAAANIGELWVSYDVQFYKPKVPNLGPAGYTLADVGHTNSTTAAANVFFAGAVTKTMNKLDSTYAASGGNFTVTIPASAPAGRYYLSAQSTYTSTVAGSAPTVNLAATISGGTLYNMFRNGSAYLLTYNTTSGVDVDFCFDHPFNTQTVLTWTGVAGWDATLARSMDFVLVALPADVGSLSQKPIDNSFDMLLDFLGKNGYTISKLDKGTHEKIKPKKKQIVIEETPSMETIE